MAKTSKRVMSTHCDVDLVAQELSGAASDFDKLAAAGKESGWSASEVRLATRAAERLERMAVAWDKATGATVAVVLLLAALVAGCTRTSPAPNAADLAPDIRYISDPRTGICFAAIQSLTSHGYRIVSITTVPCESVGTLLNVE